MAPKSPDLNPVANVFSMLSSIVYKNGKQYASIDELWNSIEIAMNKIPKDFYRKL
eukprot:GAHX01007139.1.p1 GENE.GAHX01007139.1~~GAHX01007139.1.p1  ORF type:complete len:55 (+),score=1.22 GAHX01007139.1:112-276(+)